MLHVDLMCIYCTIYIQGFVSACDITNNISVVTLNFVKPAKVMVLKNGLQCNVFGMKRMLYVTVVWSNNTVQCILWHCPLCCRALYLVLRIHCEPYVALVLLLVIAWSQEVSQWMCPFVLGRGGDLYYMGSVVWCVYDAIQLTIGSYQMF